ncbi:hypothetical protein [Thalassomonas sp. M1454]|uniref:hypothetical protein n=1 Tax=Thalassomonas sp. M1454 TaxID=2594477 RepID=UPI00117FB826|nr:hypothetical protein [Thalassomonas sp. M1454]TRX57296.1 hypothetical protein FNN08_07315 [Thalassomonas sp. M1454]
MKVISQAILPLALLFSTSYSVQATTTSNYDDLHQQMAIMGDIIKNSVSNKTDANTPSLGAIESYYLQGQGAVFNLKVSKGNTFLIKYFSDVSPVMAPRAPRAPRAVLPPAGVEESELFGENYEIIIESAMEEAQHSMEIAHEQMRMSSEQQRQLREQEREITYQLRDIERERRDLNYQKLHLDENEAAENSKELAELDKRQAALDKAMAKLDKANKEYQAKINESQQQALKAKQKFYQQLQVSVVDVMCSYGAGLKAVPDNEFINIVIKGAGDTVNKRVKDKVISFKKADIKSCVIEKISPKQLLSKANQYQF